MKKLAVFAALLAGALLGLQAHAQGRTGGYFGVGAMQTYTDNATDFAALAKQLASGGRIAGAIVDRGVARLSVGTSAGGSIGWRSLADSDVGPLPGFERPRAFTF